MSALRGLAFRTRTLPGTGLAVTALVRFAPRLVPMSLLARSADFVAYAHPDPIAEGHVLLLPRRFVATIWRARSSRRRFGALFDAAISLARELGSTEIFVNAGDRQDGRVLHVHGVPEPSRERETTAIGGVDELYDLLAPHEDAAAFTLYVRLGDDGLSFAVDSVNAVST